MWLCRNGAIVALTFAKPEACPTSAARRRICIRPSGRITRLPSSGTVASLSQLAPLSFGRAGPFCVGRNPIWLTPRRHRSVYVLMRGHEENGAGCKLEELLDRIAFTCPWPRHPPHGRTKLRKYEPRCGIYFPDIETTEPPPPDEPPPAVDRHPRLW